MKHFNEPKSAEHKHKEDTCFALHSNTIEGGAPGRARTWVGLTLLLAVPLFARYCRDI